MMRSLTNQAANVDHGGCGLCGREAERERAHLAHRAHLTQTGGVKVSQEKTDTDLLKCRTGV